jgi:hypothetical protein
MMPLSWDQEQLTAWDDEWMLIWLFESIRPVREARSS